MAYVDQIEVDGVVNELQDSTARQQINELSEVAHSGDYNDLLNKPDLSGFITRSVNDLVNYYTKTETYTKTEVNNLVNAIKQFTYEVVATLPTASASTMYKIYLVPATTTETQNIKDEYITIQSGNTYSWEQIGSTAVDLSGYSTTEQMNAAIANALTNYYTKTVLDGKLDEIDATIPIDVTRTQTDAAFVNSNNTPLLYLRQANSSLAGLMTAAGYTKLNDMPSAQEANAGIAYDVSVLHPTSGDNGGSTYASLSAALAVIPQDKRKGGMTVKFVQSSDNIYVEYFLPKDEWSDNEADWEKMNLEDEVKQLESELGHSITFTIPVTAGTNLHQEEIFNFPSGTILSFNFESTQLINTSIAVYLYNGSTLVSLYTLRVGEINDIYVTGDITKIVFDKGRTGITGTGNITINMSVVYPYATGADFRELALNTVGLRIVAQANKHIPFHIKNGETIIVKNNKSLLFTLYFRTQQSSTGQTTLSVPASDETTFTASTDYYYLYVSKSERDFTVQQNTSCSAEAKKNANDIVELQTEQINLTSSQSLFSDYVFGGKSIYLKGLSTSNIVLNLPIVLSQDGDSFEVSAKKTNTSTTGVYAFANSGLTSNAKIAIELGYGILGVREITGTWLFKDESVPEAEEYILKIEYIDGKIVTKLNGTTVNTYNSQPTIQIASFGNGGDGTYNYWGGTINYVKVNGDLLDLFTQAQLNDCEILGGASEQDSILKYDHTNDRFEFYGKYKGDKYFLFRINHVVNNNTEVLQDLWRVTDGYLCTRNGDTFTNVAQTLYGAENEWASAFSGFQAQGNFVGGYHGGELITDTGCFVKFFADGKEITSAMMVNDFTINCKEFQYIQYAGLHKVRTRGANPTIIEGQPIFAYHTKNTMIIGGKMSVLNIVKFVDNVTRTTYHSGLFCIAKGAAKNVIMPTGVLATGLTGSNDYVYADYKLIGRVETWNETNNISSNVDSKFVEGIDNSEMLTAGGEFLMWDRGNDTKYYRRSTNPVAITSGETIVTESLVDFKC